jgi:glycosyltransferase involved in cell wall biosynthesis
MKILIYWEQASWGGVDSHLYELLHNWPDKTDEIVLLINEGNSGYRRLEKYFNKITNLKCETYKSYSYNELNRKFRESRYLQWLTKPLYFLQPIIFLIDILRLRNVIGQYKDFDICLANNGGYPAAWGTISVLVAAKKIGINVRVMLIHHAAKSPSPLMGLFERLVDHLVERCATALVCVSYATRATLLQRRWLDEARLPVRVVHNAICPIEAVSGSDTQKIRDLCNIQNDVRLVGIVGRVTPYKGQEDLIYAVARLSTSVRQKLALAVIGHADSELELVRLKRIVRNLGVEDTIHFIGYIEGSSVDVLSQLDLLVVATRSFEGFGLTIVEAMMSSVPVLTTNVGAIPEFVNQSNGCLVNPSCPGEVADALQDFILNPEIWFLRAETAKKQINKTNSSMSEQYRLLFSEYLA